MSKERKSRTAGFLNLDNSPKLPTPEEVNKVIGEVTGKVEEPAKVISPPKPIPTPKVQKASKPTKVAAKIIDGEQRRVPLTTAVTPEIRAKLEVAAHSSDFSVADILNKALENYFDNSPVADKEMLKTFTSIFAKKAKPRRS